MKKLDLINGDFDQDLSMMVTMEGDKVATFEISGTRGDPANLFLFIGTIYDVFQMFGQKLDDETIKSITSDLGLMRGDSADDIGKPRVLIKPYAEVRCLAQAADVSTGVSCLFRPRF